MKRILLAAWLPLICFTSYCFDLWIYDLSETDFLYGVLVTAVLIISLYRYPIQEIVKHRKFSWKAAMIVAAVFWGIGSLGFDHLAYKLEADIYDAWGDYIWIFSYGMFMCLVGMREKQNEPSGEIV